MAGGRVSGWPSPACAAVSRRVEELARPKRFYSEFYNHCR